MGLDVQNDYELTPREQEVARMLVNCAYRVHREIGPGMLEHVYEVCFCHELQQAGLKVQRQVWQSVTYDNITFDEAYRMDVVVENLIICELKAIEETTSLHKSQLRTYLKFADKRVGFLINFNVTLIKQGIRRVTL